MATLSGSRSRKRAMMMNALDIFAAKAKVAALATLSVVVEQVEAAAEHVITGWFSALHAAIKALPDERRSAYDEIKQQAEEPQLVDVIVPVSRIEMTYELEGDKRTPLPIRERHVLSDELAHYPIGKLRAWEIAVLDTELGRDDTVAWYRNPSSVIVDPHGHHLNDALDKLRALADFAEEFGEHFMRIEAVSKNEKGDLGTALKGKLVMLDLQDKKVRASVRKSESAPAAYRDAGIAYE
jgi:type III restriction enzyme